MLTVNTLHLEYRDDRYESMVNQAREQRFQIRWWVNEPNKKNPKESICLGHKRIIAYAKEQGLDRVILAEDDLRFTHPKSFDYFISQIPASFDVFYSFLYVGEVDENYKVKSEFSGGCSLYVVNKSFYDTFLSIPDNVHIDRKLGAMSKDYEMYVCPLIPCFQSGGFSDQLRKVMFYDVYLDGRSLFNG